MDEAHDTPERQRAHLAWRRADKIRKLSDRLVGVGPFGLGIDGVLAWVPVAGTIYSVGAAGLLISEALQAGASRKTLLKMAAYLGLDSVSSTVPVLGWAVDTLFPGHALAANALMKDVSIRHGEPVGDLKPAAKRKGRLASTAAAPRRGAL
jgi:hypothetical protein